MSRAPAAALFALALALLVAGPLPPAAAATLPDQAARAVWFRDAVRARSPSWRLATQTWACPAAAAPTAPGAAPAAPAAQTCDVCGPGWEGNWMHVSCRGGSLGWGESSDGRFDGVVNSVHITSVNLDGALPRELCALGDVRQLDLGGRAGAGRLVGPIEDWVVSCFPKLEEIDLSMNRLTGTIPAALARHPLLSEVKLEGNYLVGTVPAEFGSMRRLRRFQIEKNDLEGGVPASFANETLSRQLTQLHLAGNRLAGDLKALAGVRLFTATVHDNPDLCGMVPAGVRYAAGYNPAGTRLGQPC